MNLIQLYDKISAIAIEQPLVNQVTRYDIIEEWNKKNLKYGLVNIAISRGERYENLFSYHIMLHYGDRLLKDATNQLYIHSDATLTLRNIINQLAEESFTESISDNYSINYYSYQFADYLAGAYVEFDIDVEDEIGSCNILE